MSKVKIRCPECNSYKIIKRGKKHNKFQSIQRYQCKKCGKLFTQQATKYKSYPLKIILNSISLYNLGNNLEKTSCIINQKYKLQLKPQTIHTWLKEFQDICTYARLRQEAKKLFQPHETILSEKLQHKQVYNFQLHKAKLALLEKASKTDKNSKELSKEKELPAKKFQLLKAYLERIPTESFPHHIFQIATENPQEEKRASQLNMRLLEITKLQKQNQACKLAELALKIAPSNYARHETLQNFMLINDSVTIACEVPVYLTRDDISYFKNRGFTFDFQNYRTPITGHIDILQIRNGLIHILDYKPEASKVDAVEQLCIYALALASRTKLAVKDFKCAWFDENNYYEFFPLHAVYAKQT